MIVENGLDSFKMIDNASSSSLGRFRRRLAAKRLGSDSDGAPPEGNHLHNLTVLA